MVTRITAPAVPNIPLAPSDYSRQYQDQFTNVLRLYFNRISNSLQLLVGNEGGQYLSFPYGAFYDTTTQTAPAANTAYAVTFDSVDTTNSVRIDPITPSKLIVDEAGLYNFQFSLQAVKTNASAGYLYVWPRINGVDVPNSATKVTLSGSNAAAVAAWNFYEIMKADDYFQLMWAADNAHTELLAEAATAFCPAIPSVIMTVNFISLPPTNASV